MTRSPVLIFAALVAAIPLNGAFATRTLLVELLARAPAAAGEPAMNALALEACLRRVIRHEELAQKFKSDIAAYQKAQQTYNDAVAEFERDCANRFTAADLTAVKAKLGPK